MNKRFFNQQNLTRRLRLLPVLFAMLLMPIGAWAEDYGFSIGGVAVGSGNIASFQNSGVSYDADSKTLTLENATIDRLCVNVTSGFIIDLRGKNTITASTDTAAIFSNINPAASLPITIKSSSTPVGSLTITPGNNYYMAYSGVSFTYQNGLSLIPDAQYLGVGQTAVVGVSYGLTVAGVQVTNANAAGIAGDGITGGTVTFTPASGGKSAVLTLSGATINGSIVKTASEAGDQLTINLVGTNTVNGQISFQSEDRMYLGDLSFAGSGSLNITSNDQYGVFDEVSSVNTGEGLYIATDSPAPQCYNGYYINGTTADDNSVKSLTVSTSVTYPIWVYNTSTTHYTQLTAAAPTFTTPSANVDENHEGSVSFTDNTLTLTNFLCKTTENSEFVFFVGKSLQNLIVNLVGESSIYGSGFHYTGNAELTFTTSNNGKLTYTSEPSYWSNYVTVNYENGLGYYGNVISTDWPRLQIGGTFVRGTTNTVGSYSNVSFDDTTNTLTLGGVTIGSQNSTVTDIDVYIKDLKVEISGDNTVYGRFFGMYEENGIRAGTITFKKKSGAETAELTVSGLGDGNGPVTSFVSSTLGEGLYISGIGDDNNTVSAFSYHDGEYYNFDNPYNIVKEVFITSTEPDTKLWIGETAVTSEGDVFGDGKVSYSNNTLTLNGATINGPITTPLNGLVIDLKGNNTITVPSGNVIKAISSGTIPNSLTLKTSTADGKLTLTSTSDETIASGGVFSEGFDLSIDKSLALIQPDYSGRLTDGSYHTAYFAPAYGVSIENAAGGKTEIYEGNATDVFDDGGSVKFVKATNTLKLKNADLPGAINTSLSELNIDLEGNNAITTFYDGHVIETSYGDDAIVNINSTAGTNSSLTMTMWSSADGRMASEHVDLRIADPLSVISGNLTGNTGTNNSTVVIGETYNLMVANEVVTSVNASNVLGGETATVVFTPADNTTSPATPATLTLNGATIAGSILSGLENLRIVINGTNTAVQVLANTDVDGDKNITFAGGTNGGSLTITAGNDESAVSGFASVSYDGAYAAADVPFGYDKTASQQGYRKSHLSGDNSYLNALTITTVPHYPIWLYTSVLESTQINNTNKNTLLGASGNVSFDGNHTLSLKNSVNCNARIVSGLSELTISVDGDCIIASPDSGSVVRSINSAAPLTIEKASEASSASLKLAAVSFTAIKAFASLDYTGLILLSEGATYSSGALNDSNNQPLNEAIFTTGLKKPTLQMNYETDTYSFQNPNGGGTLKYSRYFANNEGTDEENQVDNGNTFQIFKNGRQYNDPYTVYFEVWVEANGNSSDKLYACRLDVKDMAATYGGTIPAPEFLPKSVEGVTVSGYSLGNHEQVAATVTEGNITLTGAGRQELDAIFSLTDGVEYIKTSTTETPQASFYLDVKPEKPTLSKAAGTYAGTQTITVTNLTPNATAWYYTYEGEEPASPNAQAFPEGGVDISSSKTLAVYYRAEYETETSMEYLYSETTKVAYTILADPELKYMQGATAVTTAEWTLGKDDNTVLPVLQNTHSVAVTYESSNTDVATVATDGTVTAVGIGTTTITATSAATSEYAAGEASYTLTVNRQLTVSFSTSNEWATYYGSENLATPKGLKAYQVTAVDGSTVTIGEIDYIPANTAVLLKNVSNNNTWSNIAASAYTGTTSTFASNKLIGTASDVDVSTISGGTVYVLYNNMFKRATGGTIPANRGYLVVEPSAVNAGNAPQLSITIGDETTSIDNGQLTIDNYAGEWYSIDGVKLNGQPQKPGLYIKNGKKVFINKK